MMKSQAIILNGVRENNLKDIVLELPRHAIVSVVGVSGSGKSSLLFRTLAAESAVRHEAVTTSGARRAFARRPDADQITGLPFCMTVAQRAIHRSSRSTIATFTGIHDALRGLVIASGEVHCTCGALIPPPTAEILTDFLFAVHPASQIEVGAIVARSRTAALREELTKLREDGFDSILVQTEDDEPRRERNLSILSSLNRENHNTLTVLLGSHKIEEKSRVALHGLLVQALHRGLGDVYLRILRRRTADSVELETGFVWPCLACNSLQPRPTVSLLSFNSAESRSGRCSSCKGIGTIESVSRDILIPDTTRSIDDGCFALVRERGSYKHLSIREDVIRGLCRDHGMTTSVPFKSLPEGLREELLLGAGKRRVQPLNAQGKNSGAKVLYHGMIPTLLKLTGTEGVACDYARSYATAVVCDACGGTRFDRARLDSYRYRGRPFTAILSETAASARDLLRSIPAKADLDERRLLRLLDGTLEALVRSGLGYVRLDRGTSTLSGGELQRLKIAGSLCSGLTHCCYVLDEPSLGLHATDNLGLLATIAELRDLGNTILLADHDPDFRRAADLIVELGPKGGSRGGEVVYVGKDHSCGRLADEPAKIKRRQATVTGRSIRVSGCTAHNLRSIEVEVPLGGLVCLTGVSGSGKSSFAHQVLFPSVTAFLQSRRTSGPTWSSLKGVDNIRAISRVGQQAIGTSVTSLVVTYLGIFDRIRDLFANDEIARSRGYTAGHFSHNRPEGRCPVCTGRGAIISGERSTDRIECTACGGSRFTEAILDVRYGGFSIGEVLQMEVDRVLDVFADEPTISISLRLLRDLGLGHLPIGRPTITLSGGEAQRLKLAYAMSLLGGHPEGLVFILDEPTAGLHRNDVQKLIDSFDRIIDGGKNTLVVIEHDLDVIGIADHIIDFGPGAGSDGGSIVYSGQPNGAIKVRASRTGEALRARSSHARRKEAGPKLRVSQLGVQSADAIPPQLTDDAVRFLKRTRDEETDYASDEEEAALLAPTYLLAGGTRSYPVGSRTVLENLRLSELLYRTIASVAHWPEQEGVTRIRNIEDAAEACMGEELIAAFSPVSAMLESRRATRSAICVAIRHAAGRGFTECINGAGVVRKLADVSGDGFTDADVFAIRIIAGTVGRKVKDSAAVFGRAFSAGGGWVTLYRKKTRSRQAAVTPVAQLTDRPLDISARRLGKRRCVPGIFDRTDSGSCPFCGGKRTLPSVDLSLLVADRDKSPCDPAFFHSDCEALLRAVWGRTTASLRFLDEEGLASLVDTRSRWDPEVWGIVCHGFPWGRFLIPGRSGEKNVDYHEWVGVIPLVLERLHLAKNRRWATAVEASRGTAKCFSCEGTGFDWLARHYRLGDHSAAEWLTGRTHQEFLDLLREHAGEGGRCPLLGPLEQVVGAGLGEIGLSATCGELSEADRRRVRTLAACQLGFAEGTYCLQGETLDASLSEGETSLLQSAGVDRRIVLVGDSAEGT